MISIITSTTAAEFVKERIGFIVRRLVALGSFILSRCREILSGIALVVHTEIHSADDPEDRREPLITVERLNGQVSIEIWQRIRRTQALNNDGGITAYTFSMGIPITRGAHASRSSS